MKTTIELIMIKDEITGHLEADGGFGEREIKIFVLRECDKWTLRDIGEYFAICSERVRQIQLKTWRKIRNFSKRAELRRMIETELKIYDR